MSTLRGVALCGAVCIAVPALAETPQFGQPIAPADIAPWDISISPDGAGLPPGSGTVAQGEAVYAAKCQACHGEKGVGGPNDALAGGAGSLAAASNGSGVYHIYGDETTFGEGYNMQQIPKEEQGLFGRMTAVMGQSYILHTPEGLRDALRRGALCVNHPYRAGPFYLLLPLNTQPARVSVNLAALPARPALPKLAPADDKAIDQAAAMIAKATKITIKAGGGTRGHDAAVRRLAEVAGAAVVLSPGSTGVLPDAHAQNMHVGGSKGSISGNYAMAEAELLIVIGSRAVCQADCSGIGYKNAQAVININGHLGDALHYNKTLALIGDISSVANRLTAKLEKSHAAENKSAWLKLCAQKKSEWIAYKRQRFEGPPLRDDVWQKPVLTQPAAIKIHHVPTQSRIVAQDAPR